jgi:hypothetical protein
LENLFSRTYSSSASSTSFSNETPNLTTDIVLLFYIMVLIGANIAIKLKPL